MSALLIVIGAVILWPILATRHGRGVSAATLVALVFGTVAYAVARSPSWEGGAAFAIGALFVRLAAPRVGAPRAAAWVAAGVLALVILLARGAGMNAVLDGLFSSWGGLLFWSPILWLALAGLVGDRGAAGALAPALLVAIALGAATTESAADHGARFAPILPLLALGLARAFASIRAFALRRPLAPVAAAIAGLAAWNLLLMAQYRDGRIPRDDTVSFPRVARNAAATVSARLGSPSAWPASWAFAAANRVSPVRYDLLGGIDLMSSGALGMTGTIDVGDPRGDEAVLESGWSVRHPCGAEICRSVEGAASLLAPIHDPRDLDVTVSAAGAGTLTMAVNGVPVLESALTGDLRPFFVRVARARWRRGVNTVAFTAAGGETLVDRIVFRVPPGAP